MPDVKDRHAQMITMKIVTIKIIAIKNKSLYIFL